MTTDVLDQIASQIESRDAQAAANYQALVRDIVNDRAKGANAAGILSAAGKSPADLRSDVEKRRELLALAALVATQPTLRKEMEEVDARYPIVQREMDAAKAAFESAKQKYADAMAGIHADSFRLAARVTEIQEASARLRESCTDSDLLIRERELAAESKQLAAERRRLTEDLGVFVAGTVGNRWAVLKQRLKLAAQAAKNYASVAGFSAGKDGDAEARRAELAQFEKAAVEPRRDRLAAIAKRLAEIAAEAQRIDAAKMTA